MLLELVPSDTEKFFVTHVVMRFYKSHLLMKSFNEYLINLKFDLAKDLCQRLSLSVNPPCAERITNLNSIWLNMKVTVGSDLGRNLTKELGIT